MSQNVHLIRLASRIAVTTAIRRQGLALSKLLTYHNVCVPKESFHNSVASSVRLYSTASASSEVEEKSVPEDYHTIISDQEKAHGPSEKREFQAETKMLLDIVAKSLYSEKEVFVRELTSNASDALEKLRFLQMTGGEEVPHSSALEIHIATDRLQQLFIIQDTGLGMTREELIEHLGTIAKSGSKAFMNELKDKGQLTAENIIGQFGVGFYSVFMVADSVEVYTRSYKPGSPGLKWTSDGSGSYEISEADNVQQGTKIVVHLKTHQAAEFADDKKIGEIIKKYNNFVTCPMFLNGKRVNSLQALWTMDAKDVTAEQHDEFYRFLSHNTYDSPRYCLHYKADAPINIRALFYVPEHKPTMFDMSQSTDTGVALYSRRVMIQPKANTLLPKWMRFLKGVVDSEDIPLNLSRELLQQSAVINKLKAVLTNRIIKFLQDQVKRDPEKYQQFHDDYALYMKECIISSDDQSEKEEVATLLLFESSNKRPGVKVGLLDYVSRMQAGQRDIYYLCSPSRELAESSPYYEALRSTNFEILFCYENYDELVLLNLRQFDRKTMTSVEKAVRTDKSDDVEKRVEGMSADELKEFTIWIQQALGEKKVKEIKVTSKISGHPCFITVEEMGAARHFVKTQFSNMSEDQRYFLLQPTLEINPTHPIMKHVNTLRTINPNTAKLAIEQIYDNAMVSAGLVEDTRSMVGRLNNLLESLLSSTVGSSSGPSASSDQVIDVSCEKATS